ncbi:nitrate- and nitrite sensing domain-containing protein [Streptomyces sp. enrichment culture]|uniref:sensor histidine kinase n=1 Tax=Streptomyces sp. enrichment culture TaxID=1795815 RepID=UPI003F567512
MRAPVQKTRPRRKDKQAALAGDAQQTPTVGRGRPTHVRNRLVVAVAVVAAAIAGAGAPSVLAASQQLHDAQELVTLAERTEDALTLAHSLADERDEVVPYIAAGRPESEAPSEEHSARVDRQVEELRADEDTSQALRDELDAVAAVRRAALTGKSSALEAHQAYSTVISQLHRLAARLADRTPPRAGSGGHALAELDTAVQQAAATRGLLLAALNVPSTTETVLDPVTGLPVTVGSTSEADEKRRDELSAAALQARVRSDAALAGFRDAAPKAARASYDSTVTGPEVDTAEEYLGKLTDKPTLSDSELDTGTEKLAAALTARIDMMRGVEAALFDQRTKDLAQLRDEDVTELEIRIAVLGALMLLAVGVATAMARSLTRPLSVLRRGSARLAEAEDPAAEEPVTFTGRNDEFAQVVRSVNALHAHAAGLAQRIATLEADRKHLVGQRQKMADAREELRSELAEATARMERMRHSIDGTFVNLALRTLGLVERQLGVIEGLEQREDDPDRLATLFKLDHFATVMRRHSENLLVLAGAEHGRQTAGPVPLVDVVRAAVSEIERYERVRIAALPPHAHIAGFAADDLSHLLAELMENATSFSPPDGPVEVSGWLLENGEVMLSVQDEGIGMAEDRLERLNTRLSEFDPEAAYDAESDDGLGLGLYVVARLAHRHGVRVRLRKQKQGGIAAVVVLPDPLLAPATPTAVPSSAPSSVPDGTPTVSLPGADAEANSNELRGRGTSGDPLVDLAEKALEAHAAAGTSSSAASATPPASEGASADARGAQEAGETPEPSAAAEAPSAADTPTTPDTGTSHGPDEAAPAAVTEPEPPAPRAAAGSAAEQARGGSAPAAPDAPAVQAAAPGAVAGPASGGTASGTAEGAQSRTGVPGDADAPAAHTVPPVAGEEPLPGSETTPVAPQASEPHAAASAAGTGPAPGEAASAPEPSRGAPEPEAQAPAERPAETTMELFIPAQPDGRAPAGAGDAASDDRPTAAGGHGAGTAPPADEAVRPGSGHAPAHGTGPAPEAAQAPGGPAPAPAAAQEPRAGLPDRPVTGDAAGRPEHARVADGPAEDEPVTAKGLPKRTPKITAPVAPPRSRSGSVDAEALRRRLGGFRRGADAGRRDAEAELAAERSRGDRTPSGTDAATEEATGGTVEEASS